VNSLTDKVLRFDFTNGDSGGLHVRLVAAAINDLAC